MLIRIYTYTINLEKKYRRSILRSIKVNADNRAVIDVTMPWVPKKQKGATLFTSLVFLILMTIVSVASSKMSRLDIMVSGIIEQQMRLFQTTENDLNTLTTVVKLYKPLIKETGHEFDPITGIYEVPDTPQRKKMQITDLDKTYSCKGFNGEVVSIGPNVPTCDLYDFQVKSAGHGGARDRHNRGAGKEKPNANKNSYL